jgi:hypothetical protein
LRADCWGAEGVKEEEEEEEEEVKFLSILKNNAHTSIDVQVVGVYASQKGCALLPFLVEFNLGITNENKGIC